ncbi:MAG: TonB family protein [Acidobacteriia bacterium]|nr:TonB family protein [Terriglobia bacterium]
MSDSWKRWEGQLVSDKFPLQRLLGRSEHGTVFLVDKSAGGRPQTAIKFVPAASVDANEQLRQWKVAADLDRPNVIRIFESGRCDLGGTEFLYVLTEYAEEELSQILPERALTDQEARQVLDAVLKGLAYVHAKGFVHGGIKPSNILAAGDVVKISSDSLRAAGAGKLRQGEKSAYDAPETARGQLGPPADVWSLGVTLVEMLTQRLPVLDSEAGNERALPDGIPQPFREIVENCLQIDPAKRWAVAEIAARLDTGKREAPGAQALPSEPAARAGREAGAAVLSYAGDQKTSAKWPYALAFVAVVVVAAVLVLKPKAPVPFSEARTGVSALHPEAAGSGATEASSSAHAEPAEAGSDQGRNDEMLTKPGTRGGVATRVIPRVSPGARHTIRGKIRVPVKVDVDAAGNVTQARLQSAVASEYFARLALEAARGWKFKPVRANGQAVPSEWVVRFYFSRGGTDGSAEQTAP